MRVARRSFILTLALSLPAASFAALDKKPKSASFVVYRVETRAGGEIVVTFQGGEVWQQLKPDVKIELKRGDSVVIRRRGGAFLLESPQGLSTRVKRVM